MILIFFKEIGEIEKLTPLVCLGELSFINNPVKSIQVITLNRLLASLLFRCLVNLHIDFL